MKIQKLVINSRSLTPKLRRAANDVNRERGSEGAIGGGSGEWLGGLSIS